MNALILAGGESKRMGRNKALIERPDGIRQIDHITALVRGVSDAVYLSLKDEGTVPSELPIIPDIRPGEGPLAALESAAAACGGPLLVLGCDLYLMDSETLALLISRRDPADRRRLLARTDRHRGGAQLRDRPRRRAPRPG